MTQNRSFLVLQSCLLKICHGTWRRKWQPIPVFLLGKSHGQRSLMGYSPWNYKESDTTEQLKMHGTNTLTLQQRQFLVSSLTILVS